MTKLFSTVVTVFSCAFSILVMAGPVNYSESGTEFEEMIGNDFDGVNKTFILDVGLNSISGTQQFEDRLGDAFAFTIQEGHQLVAATFNVLTFAGYEGNSASAVLGSDPTRWSTDLGSSDSLGAGESSSFSVHSWNYLELPLAPSTYIAICCGGGYRGTRDGYPLPVFTYRFDFQIEVAPMAVTIANAGTGSGTTGGDGDFYIGESVALTATPNIGSTFTGWGGDAICTAGFTMPDVAVNCTAIFTLNDDDDDGVANFEDNCLSKPNPDQADGDENDIGDVCEDLAFSNGFEDAQ